MTPTPGSHRHGCGQNDVQWSCQSSHLQRTANSVLFRCLRRGSTPASKSRSITRLDDCLNLNRPQILLTRHFSQLRKLLTRVSL